VPPHEALLEKQLLPAQEQLDGQLEGHSAVAPPAGAFEKDKLKKRDKLRSVKISTKIRINCFILLASYLLVNQFSLFMLKYILQNCIIKLINC
jgi:hypothetical protein